MGPELETNRFSGARSLSPSVQLNYGLNKVNGYFEGTHYFYPLETGYVSPFIRLPSANQG